MTDLERHLIEGLVGDRRHLYLTNPWFKTAVDQFVQFLPYFVDGLAEDAEERQAEMERRTYALTHALGPPVQWPQRPPS